MLASIPASEAALPVPVELADAPSPLASAVPLPSANEFVEAVRSVTSVEPSVSASMCARADAEPSPEDAAETSTLAEELAEAEPSSPSDRVAEPEVSEDAVPLIEPPPVVETSILASAEDDADAASTSSPSRSVVSPEKVVDWPSANAWPVAEPSPLDEPLRLTEDVVPSAVAALAEAEPEAVAPAPDVVRFTSATTPPSLPNEPAVLPSAVDESVAVSLPVAVAPVVVEESAVLPLASSLCAVALPPADADAPAPSAEASECDEVPAEPPPATE